MTEAGNEPVRDELKRLGRPIKTVVGEDVRFVELNWRVDNGNEMILVHFFQKKSQKTPKAELNVGWDRMKKWMKAQKASKTSKPSRRKK